MRISPVLAATALSLVALPALADDGLRFGLGWTKNVTIDTRLVEVYGQYHKELGVNFAIQGDITVNKYSFDTDSRFNLALHAAYKPTDETWVGAYVGRQDWFGNDFNYYGVEYGWRHPAWYGDMHIGRFDAATGTFERTLYGADVSVNLSHLLKQVPVSPATEDRISAKFGLHGVADGTDEQLVYVGLGYKVQSDWEISARASRVLNADHDQIGVFLEYMPRARDSDVPFSRRGWTAAFKAW